MHGLKRPYVPTWCASVHTRRSHKPQKVQVVPRCRNEVQRAQSPTCLGSSSVMLRLLPRLWSITVTLPPRATISTAGLAPTKL